MDISKKDLLKETGISYGQLYRWKREGLIPESWFKKKASYTGQETYFPKEAIIKRINAIQQLKDTHSLEELAKILSPEVSNRLFSEEDLETFEEINIDIAVIFMDTLEKDNFTFMEVVIMIAFSEFAKEQNVDYEKTQEMILYMKPALADISSIDYILFIVRMDASYFTIFVKENTSMYMDHRMQVVKQFHLQEVSNALKVKYKDAFQFTFDEEVS